MPQITIERVMADVDVQEVWRAASDLLSYPTFMDQVISVELADIGAGRTGTSWVVMFNGNELRWIEEDLFFPNQLSMSFQQIDGDLAQWRGAFSITQTDSETIARYVVEFDLGIPALADVLHPLGERAIRANCEQMLEQMEWRARSVLSDNA